MSASPNRECRIFIILFLTHLYHTVCLNNKVTIKIRKIYYSHNHYYSLGQVVWQISSLDPESKMGNFAYKFYGKSLLYLKYEKYNKEPNKI